MMDDPPAHCLRCPRDGAALVGGGPPGAGPSRCPECDGLWAASAALGGVSHALAQIERARDQVLASARHGLGVGACVGCGAEAVALCYYEVPLDWCPQCGGVWLDGGEVAILRERVRGLRGDLGAALAPFRAAPTAVVVGTVTCGACGATVPVNDSYITADGPRCVTCAMESEGQLPSADTAAEVDAFLDAREVEAHRIAGEWAADPAAWERSRREADERRVAEESGRAHGTGVSARLHALLTLLGL